MFRIRFDCGFCLSILLAVPTLAAAQNTLFTTISVNATAAAPAQIATGDFNGDGIMDMAVTVPTQNVVDIFIGNGDGNFAPAASYAAGSFPLALVAGDFNHDGHIDLAVADGVAGGRILTLFGKGDGTFVAGGSYFAGLVPFAIGEGDFDGDGNLDLAVVDYGQGSTPGSVTILLGKSDGSFQTTNNYPVGASPVTIAVGDFTGDGRPDLAVGFDGTAGVPQSQVLILPNNGNGSFQAGVVLTAPVPGGIASVTAGDFDGDGKLDIAAVSAFSSSVTLFHGNGNGTFDSVSASPSVSKGSFWISAGDINGDGKVDLVSANSDGTISVLLGNGDDTFTNKAIYPVGPQLVALSLTDLNGDGNLDVAAVSNATVLSSGGNDVQVLLGHGDGTFFSGTLQVGASPGGIASGDFNGDGIPDLAITKGDATVAIFLGDDHGGFTALPPFVACQTTGAAPGKIAAADVNGDNKIDLAIGCAGVSSGSSFVNLFQGNGDGTFVNPLAWGVGDPLLRIIAADINGDGVPEFVVANDIGVAAVNLDDTFFDNIVRNVSVQDVAAGDFNGDNKTDLLAIGSGTVPGIILFGDGAGNFQQGSTLGWNGGLTGDFNGDGLTDFLNYQPDDLVQVILNQGNGTFLLSSEVFGTPLGRPQALADFDGDGLLDVLTAFRSGAPLNVFLGHEDGTFDQQPAVSLSQLGIATVAVADFDGNGSPDVAALDSTSGTVSILLNKNSFHPTTTQLSATQGNVVAGGPIALSAAVVSKQGTPTGVVKFKQAGVPQMTGSLINGIAQATLSAPSTTGTYGFTALYTGSGTFGGSLSQRLVVTVSAASTTTTVAASASPSKLGQSVTFTATVHPQFSGTPTGTVQFYADGNPIGLASLSGGEATFSTAALTMGTHVIQADYSGDSSFTTSLGSMKEKIGAAASTVTVTSSANPAVYGQPVTLTATVTDSEGQTPTGFVVFAEGSTVYGTVSLSGGTARVSLPAIVVGMHTINVQYSGDSSDAPAKISLKQTITGVSSSTVVTTSAEPSTYGQGVTFTAAVSGSLGTADGTVTFKNGPAVLGTVSLIGGQAMLVVSTLNGGTHTINAVYSGNSEYAQSSGSVSQIIEPAATTTTLASSQNPSTYGDPVTFTATVGSGATAAPTGNVTIKDGKTILGTVPLINGQAQISTSLLTTGGHTLTATYTGSANFSKSSGTISQTVK